MEAIVKTTILICVFVLVALLDWAIVAGTHNDDGGD